MGDPVFLLQIIDAYDPERPLRLPGGGSLERDLINVCVDAIVKRGVGFFKTEAKVKQAIADGLTEAIRELKRQSRYTLK